MTVNAKTLVKIQATDSVAMDDGNVLYRHLLEEDITWPDGATAGAIEAVWSDTRTITATEFANLDLVDLDQLDTTTGVLKTLNFKNIKAIFVKVTSGASSILTIGGGTDGAAAADAWAGAGTPFSADAMTIVVTGSANGSNTFMWKNDAGGTVTGGAAANILCLGATGADVTVTTVIIGESN